MDKRIPVLAIMASVALAGCEQMTAQERAIAGGATGAAIGALTAEALGADSDWRILAALAGAAAGVLVAQNEATGECAYARGDGTYRVARCP